MEKKVFLVFSGLLTDKGASGEIEAVPDQPWRRTETTNEEVKELFKSAFHQSGAGWG